MLHELDEVDDRGLLSTDEPTAADALPIPPLRGLVIAAATFVPVFLAIFFGLPYLLGNTTTARTAGTPGPSPPVAATAPREPLERSSPIEPTTPRAPEPAPAAPTTEPARPPALPPASSRTPEPASPAVARSGPEPRPTPDASRSGEWTPAAAFADREPAGRLASSIQKQGYPVEVRQDGSSSRPWVVWIGAQPSGARRR